MGVFVRKTVLCAIIFSFTLKEPIMNYHRFTKRISGLGRSLVFLGMIWTASSALSAETLRLADDGKTDWTIVLPDAPTPVEKTAADELALHLKGIAGVDFPIAAEGSVPKDGKNLFLIGGTERTGEFLKRWDKPAFAFDEILIRGDGDNLILTGHERRGTLYAVFTFLEDCCGCRWWTPDAGFIPRKPTLTIPAGLSISYAPEMISREVYYPLEGKFSARMKGNGSIPPEYGGRVEIVSFVHSFDKYIPSETYFADHPDWFAERDGVRGRLKGQNGQLCLTNDAMRAELTRNVLETLRANPGAKIIDVSQNDNENYCECEKCRAIDEAQGSHSGSLIAFINQVAADVEKEFPDVLVETLAYLHTRKPPKTIKPRDNVLIRLCSIECRFSEPLSEGINKPFADDLRGWRAISKQLFVWDYVTDYNNYVGPFPNFAVLAPNVKFFADNRVIGLFNEGEGPDFIETRNWVLLKLMWDPTLDGKALLRAFCDGYYGPEITPFLEEYLTILTDRGRESNAALGCFSCPLTNWLDVKTLTRLTEIFDRAVAKSTEIYGANSPQAERLKKSKMAIDNAWLKYYEFYRALAAEAKIPFAGPADPVAAMKNFLDLCVRFKIRELKINEPLDVQKELDLFRGRIAAQSADIPDFCRDIPENRRVILDDAYLRMSNATPPEVDDPAAYGGKATRLEPEIRGWNMRKGIGSVGKFHVWVALRAESGLGDGIAVTCRALNLSGITELASHDVSVSEIKGPDYHWIDLGVIDFVGSAAFCFERENNPEIPGVLIDRIVMIKDE